MHALVQIYEERIKKSKCIVYKTTKRIEFTSVQNILRLEIKIYCIYYSTSVIMSGGHSISTVYIIVQDVLRLEINVLYTLVQNVLHLEEKNVCIQ